MPTLPTPLHQRLRRWLPAIALALASLPTLAANVSSLNRVYLDGCPAVVSGPGTPASGRCEANGNASNSTAGSSSNGAGQIEAGSDARVNFYTLRREVRTSSIWLDTLLYLGGAQPDRVELLFGLDGTLANEIVPGTISPPGSERGSASARLTAAAMPQRNWAGSDGNTAINVSRGPFTSPSSSYTQDFSRRSSIVLELDTLVDGALLDVYWSVDTTALAHNDWIRDGAGSVQASAQARGGLLGLRWLDANGQDLGSAVSWAWLQGASGPVLPLDPNRVPLPGTAPLLALGLGLLALRGRAALAARAVAAVCLLGAAAAGAAQAQTSVVPNVTYCSPLGLAQQLDLHLPDPGRHPGLRSLAVFVHGGGWTSGSRTDPRARPEIDELQARGYVVAAVDYRLAPAHPFPAALDDVRCAVRFLRAQAARWQIDPQRVVVWGGSAGGHIAGLLAYTRPGDAIGSAPTEWASQSHQVRAAALLYAPLDLPTLYAGAAPSAWTPVFGNDPAALARYSPVAYVRAGSVPTLLLHGNRDTLVPPSQSLGLMQRLQQANVPAQLQLVANAGHSLDLSGGAALYPGRGDIARLVGRFFDVETLAPSDAVLSARLSDTECVAEWLPTRRSSDFNGAHSGLQTRAGASGPLQLRSFAGSQTWWATDGPLFSQAALARAGDCGLDARR